MTDAVYQRLRPLTDPEHLPALKPEYAHRRPALGLGELDPPPRVLLLYGSLRERSYSRLAVEEAARLLQLFGCETRIFDPYDLPLPDQVKDDDHPAVHELREHSLWSEAQVWCSPERHGQVTGIMKAQIDHLPLAYKGLRPPRGAPLRSYRSVRDRKASTASTRSGSSAAGCGCSRSPNQSSVAKAYDEFDEAGRMKPSSYYDRIVDVMEELVRFTVLLRPHAEQLVDRYSERKDRGQPVDTPVEAAKLNTV